MKSVFSHIKLFVCPVFLIFCACNKKYDKTANLPVNTAYHNVDLFNQFYFDTGSFWVYQDYITKRFDTVRCINTFAADHFVYTDEYKFLVQHGKVDFFSTAKKKSFGFYFDFPEYSRVMARHYHDVYYVDEITPIFLRPLSLFGKHFYTDHYGSGMWPMDSIFLKNGTGYFAEKTNFILKQDSFLLYLAKNIGVVKKQVYRKIDNQLIEDWEILNYKAIPRE